MKSNTVYVPLRRRFCSAHSYLFFFFLLVNEFIMQPHKVTVKRGQFRSSLSERLTFTPVAPYCLAAANHSIYFHGLADSSLPLPPFPSHQFSRRRRKLPDALIFPGNNTFEWSFQLNMLNIWPICSHGCLDLWKH